MCGVILNNKKGIVNHKRDKIYYGASGNTGTVDKLKALYDKSGSKKPFTQWLNDLKKSHGNNDTPVLDWLQSDSAKNALAKAQGLVDTFQGGKNEDGGTSNQTNNDNNNSDDKNEVTILGFHPITFALGTTALLIVGYFGGRFLINKFSK